MSLCVLEDRPGFFAYAITSDLINVMNDELAYRGVNVKVRCSGVSMMFFFGDTPIDPFCALYSLGETDVAPSFLSWKTKRKIGLLSFFDPLFDVLIGVTSDDFEVLETFHVFSENSMTIMLKYIEQMSLSERFFAAERFEEGLFGLRNDLSNSVIEDAKFQKDLLERFDKYYGGIGKTLRISAVEELVCEVSSLVEAFDLYSMVKHSVASAQVVQMNNRMWLCVSSRQGLFLSSEFGFECRPKYFDARFAEYGQVVTVLA